MYSACSRSPLSASRKRRACSGVNLTKSWRALRGGVASSATFRATRLQRIASRRAWCRTRCSCRTVVGDSPDRTRTPQSWSRCRGPSLVRRTLPNWGTVWRRMSCSYLVQVRGPSDDSTVTSQAARNCSTVVRSSPNTWPSRCACSAVASLRATSVRVLPYRNLRRRLPPCQPRSIAAAQRPSGGRWIEPSPWPSSSAAHAAVSRRSPSTYSVTAAAGMRRQAPIRTDWMTPVQPASLQLMINAGGGSHTGEPATPCLPALNPAHPVSPSPKPLRPEDYPSVGTSVGGPGSQPRRRRTHRDRPPAVQATRGTPPGNPVRRHPPQPLDTCSPDRTVGRRAPARCPAVPIGPPARVHPGTHYPLEARI
jgi:hypothetical protein